MEILRVENLTFKYPGSENTALNGVSFSVNSGDFVVLCGESGCGKTTLLKLLKKSLSPKGELSGEILYFGKSRNEISDKTDAEDIGFVLQNPETQIVTDKVWHELAFGLENLGIKTDVIRRRVAEMANYFGINGWFRKKTSELSGGQKQLLNLAAVMVMQPKVLILDEPTSRLDPIAASDFLATLNKLNRELGLTVIIAEHCLEEVFRLPTVFCLWKTARCFLMTVLEILHRCFRKRIIITKCLRHFLRQLERFAPLAVLVYVGNERPCVVPVVTPAAEDHPPSVTAPRVVAFHVVGVDFLHWTYLACT